MYKDIVFLDGTADDYQQAVIKFMDEWESYSPVLTVSTSGTTGHPKTFEFSKKQAEASARATGRFFDFKKGDVVLLNLSPEFIASKLMMIRAMVHELKLVIAPLKSNPLENLEKLPFKIKLGAFVPYQVDAILQNDQSRKLYQQIENVIIGGAQIPADLEKKISVLSNKNYATFGMTETLTHFALRPVDGKTDFYTCLPGSNISQDERGCLVVEPNEIVTERLTTNDVIELIDSTHFHWMGRIDNVINSGGVKIYPETDELLIQQFFNSNRFYLSSKPSDKLGEEVVLMVEGKPWPTDDQYALLERISDVLPKYHAPKSINFVDRFAETSSGKVKRKKPGS